MILVTGANGYVGQKIMQMRTDVIACPSLRGLSEEEVRRIVEESGADTIVHTAAISDIGVCQANPEASYIANVQLPLYLAHACKGKKLICFSSDQVYSGLDEEGPYTEDKVMTGSTFLFVLFVNCGESDSLLWSSLSVVVPFTPVTSVTLKQHNKSRRRIKIRRRLPLFNVTYFPDSSTAWRSTVNGGT
jgi:hypothetical protein